MRIQLAAYPTQKQTDFKLMPEPFWEFNKNSSYLYWKGFCNKDRNIGIYEVERVVNKYGFIIDFHMFSDLEINLKIEIEERNISSLYHGLAEVLTLNDLKKIPSTDPTGRLILMNITFTQSTGDLRIEVPAVPG